MAKPNGLVLGEEGGNLDALHEMWVRKLLDMPELVGETREGLADSSRPPRPYNQARRRFEKSADVLYIYHPHRSGSREHCTLVEFKVGDGTNRDKAIVQLEASASYIDQGRQTKRNNLVVSRAIYAHLVNHEGSKSCLEYEVFTREELAEVFVDAKERFLLSRGKHKR